MRKVILIWIIPVWVLFQTCSDEGTTDFTRTIDARTFRVNTPPSWTLQEGTGYDTYVGSISHFKDTIFFDQGFNSFGGLQKIQPTTQTIYMKYLAVDGLPAILHKRVVDDNNRKRVQVTLFVDAGDYVHLNRLYFFDPANPIMERVMINIMKTHQFK